MNIFHSLEEIYLEIDSKYSTLEAQARFRGHNRREAFYSLKRTYNDEAYFLYMFTRLEDRIKILSNSIIDAKMISISDWKLKRPWAILERRKSKIPLLDRVIILTEINQADYHLIARYYNQRNSLGHGGNFTIAINMTTAIADFQRLYDQLNI